MADIDARISRVLARDACSGCGACTLLDPGLRMQLDSRGYTRPVRVRDSPDSTNRASHFDSICPGVRVTAPPTQERQVHDIFGPYVEVWHAWATDPEIRRRGSSGGTLTALSEWLIATGQAHKVTGAAAGSDPRRTVPVTIMSREDALKAAGSRYAPVAAASNADSLEPSSVAIGKPCEISALRAINSRATEGQSPLLLSFFCAGTSSSLATETLMEQLGFAKDEAPDELWYRGRGWPGEFTVRSGSRLHSTSYQESWGRVLGPSTQWRCKVCVDGTGEHADVVAADSWLSDEDGYPLFDEGDGISALIARTRRGQTVVRAAIAAGVLTAEPANLDDLAGIQPLQVERRKFLLARLIGSLAAGRVPPRYPGYGITMWRLLMKHPRLSARVARGTWQRVRNRRRSSA